MRNLNRCPFCKRSKSRAIREQVSKRLCCEIAGCPFIEEIGQAIEEKKKITVIKKTKPVINVEKKQKPLIIVEKKPKPVINVKKK